MRVKGSARLSRVSTTWMLVVRRYVNRPDQSDVVCTKDLRRVTGETPLMPDRCSVLWELVRQRSAVRLNFRTNLT